MNIINKIENKHKEKYKKLLKSNKFIKKVSFLNKSRNNLYKDFYEILLKMKDNNISLKQEEIIQHLTIISIKDHKLLKLFNKINYENYNKDLKSFLNNLNTEVDLFISIKEESNIQLKNSIACLLGLACGDALGTTLEFTKNEQESLAQFGRGEVTERGSQEHHTDIIGGGVFKLKAGEWTDDTSMALCISKSLQEDGFSLKGQMDNYVKWMRHGYLSSNGRCFDIGVTTSNAIKQYLHLKNPKAGSKEIHHSGNGSIMRLAPIPIYFYQNINKTIQYSAESSLTTHGSPECIESCMLLGAILNLFINNINNESKKELIFNSNLESILNLKEQKVIQLLNGDSWLKLKYEELPNTGYVIDTLRSALWCLYYSNNFKEALTLAVNLCGDADTIGAVCGQLAGAYYGYDQIPNHWISIIKESTYIQKEAYSLFLKK